VSLSDKIDILEAIARYSYAYDGRDASGFAQLFTEDGIFEVAHSAGKQLELRLESRQAIYAWVAQRHEQVVKNVRDRHFQSGTLFDALSDEQAQTRTMVLITHQRDDDPVPRPVLSGVYHDRWRKTDNGWRIAQRSLHHDHCRPYLNGLTH
jgi:ketosteroid isomerase-like protein